MSFLRILLRIRTLYGIVGEAIKEWEDTYIKYKHLK